MKFLLILFCFAKLNWQKEKRKLQIIQNNGLIVIIIISFHR